jgi:hypothetical protein
MAMQATGAAGGKGDAKDKKKVIAAVKAAGKLLDDLNTGLTAARKAEKTAEDGEQKDVESLSDALEEISDSMKKLEAARKQLASSMK